MKKVVTTQEELDSTPIDFQGEIVITGGTVDLPINLTKRYENANVILSRNAVISMYGSSQVKEMWGSSQVKEMRGSSQVKEMWESSQVKEMRGSSQVKEMRGSSQVKEMWGSSQVKEMWESSQVKEMWESSQVKEMWGSGLIGRVLGSNNKISCFGYNYVFVTSNTNTSGIILNETSQIILVKTFRSDPNVDFYLKNYSIRQNKNGTLIMYKSVHKTESGEYVSDYDKSFKYPIGKKLKHETSKDTDNSCSPGLHVGDLRFAVEFGKSWSSMAILELEVPKDKIVVSVDCNGKVRTSELKVLRELPLEDYKHLL